MPKQTMKCDAFRPTHLTGEYAGHELYSDMFTKTSKTTVNVHCPLSIIQPSIICPLFVHYRTFQIVQNFAKHVKG